MTDQPQDRDETQPVDETELEEQNGEELPKREAMSVVTAPGDSLGPPPVSP